MLRSAAFPVQGQSQKVQKADDREVAQAAAVAGQGNLSAALALFAGDGEKHPARVIRLVVVQGGETGWHMSYQTMGGSYPRGPWHMDKLWHPLDKGHHVAWALPPIAWINSGPSGMTYNPGGVALPKRYNDHFFICD